MLEEDSMRLGFAVPTIIGNLEIPGIRFEIQKSILSVFVNLDINRHKILILIFLS